MKRFALYAVLSGMVLLCLAPVSYGAASGGSMTRQTVLIQSAKDPDPAVRQVAARSLGESKAPSAVAVLSGMFELIRWLGLYNNLMGLILSYMIFTLPFTVWVLTTFMRELPKELEEAATLAISQAVRRIFKQHGTSLTPPQAQEVAACLFGD